MNPVRLFASLFFAADRLLLSTKLLVPFFFDIDLYDIDIVASCYRWWENVEKVKAIPFSISFHQSLTGLISLVLIRLTISAARLLAFGDLSLIHI